MSERLEMDDELEDSEEHGIIESEQSVQVISTVDANDPTEKIRNITAELIRLSNNNSEFRAYLLPLLNTTDLQGLLININEEYQKKNDATVTLETLGNIVSTIIHSCIINSSSSTAEKRLTIQTMITSIVLPCPPFVSDSDLNDFEDMLCKADSELYFDFYKLVAVAAIAAIHPSMDDLHVKERCALAYRSLGILARRMKTPDLTASEQWCILEALNITKDSCPHGNVFKAESLEFLRLLSASNKGAYENILRWNECKTALRGNVRGFIEAQKDADGNIIPGLSSPRKRAPFFAASPSQTSNSSESKRYSLFSSLSKPKPESDESRPASLSPTSKRFSLFSSSKLKDEPEAHPSSPSLVAEEATEDRAISSSELAAGGNGAAKMKEMLDDDDIICATPDVPAVLLPAARAAPSTPSESVATPAPVPVPAPAPAPVPDPIPLSPALTERVAEKPPSRPSSGTKSGQSEPGAASEQPRNMVKTTSGFLLSSLGFSTTKTLAIESAMAESPVAEKPKARSWSSGMGAMTSTSPTRARSLEAVGSPPPSSSSAGKLAALSDEMILREYVATLTAENKELKDALTEQVLTAQRSRNEVVKRQLEMKELLTKLEVVELETLVGAAEVDVCKQQMLTMSAELNRYRSPTSDASQGGRKSRASRTSSPVSIPVNTITKRSSSPPRKSHGKKKKSPTRPKTTGTIRSLRSPRSPRSRSPTTGALRPYTEGTPRVASPVAKKSLKKGKEKQQSQSLVKPTKPATPKSSSASAAPRRPMSASSATCGKPQNKV